MEEVELVLLDGDGVTHGRFCRLRAVRGVINILPFIPFLLHPNSIQLPIPNRCFRLRSLSRNIVRINPAKVRGLLSTSARLKTASAAQVVDIIRAEHSRYRFKLRGTKTIKLWAVVCENISR